MKLKLTDGTIAFTDQGSGNVLVLFHAFPLDHRMWDAQVSDLSRNFRIITLDSRGLGVSIGPCTIENIADDAAHILDHLRIERAVIGGLSMGGYAALAFARRHPNRLAGLMLADTRAAADDEAGRAGRDQAIMRIVRGDLTGYIDEFVTRLVAPGHTQALKLASAIASLQTMNGVVSAIAALRDRPDATQSLEKINVPSTIIVGSEDTLTPPTMAREMARKIRGAILLEIAGAGHLTNLEATSEFNRALEQLLKRAYPAE